MDRASGGSWQFFSASETTVPACEHQILTLDAPAQDYAEYLLYAPAGIWNSQARNARGRVVEASLQVDPADTGTCAMDGGWSCGQTTPSCWSPRWPATASA